MTDQPTETPDTSETPDLGQADLSDAGKKKLNPKLQKLADIRARAEAVIEQTEEDEIELIEDALNEEFGNAATTPSTPAAEDSGSAVAAGELPPVEAYQPADSGAPVEDSASEPATLEPSAPSEGATGGTGDASSSDSGAADSGAVADSGASAPESGAEPIDVEGTATASGPDASGPADSASSGESAGASADAEIVSHPGTPQQDAGVVNSTDNAQPSSVTERDALPADAVPDGEVPVNNGNPNSPQTVAVSDVVGEGTNLTADNSPLPPDAVSTDPVAEKLAAAQPQNTANASDVAAPAVSNTEAQTTSDAAPLPATTAQPNTPISEG